MIYFISYDISNPKRLNKAAKILENFGIRIQFSFFECEMEKMQLEEIKSALLEVINKKEDSLRIYPLCQDCASKSMALGNGDIFIPKTFEIL
ncbi:MAG: CRISPR-associated endonuclease Cas2 [Bacteroides sp.]|nr:CRISPR-associated endonuclease Cas2 [Prevotella sp.]MCM1406942.1 CRISPR-associated endonuclease Cas2 [Treponema brennaborense]MCM1470093.1 CRISPR-associated endonuclease Cas2 [Bacteroides sp.]